MAQIYITDALARTYASAHGNVAVDSLPVGNGTAVIAWVYTAQSATGDILRKKYVIDPVTGVIKRAFAPIKVAYMPTVTTPLTWSHNTVRPATRKGVV